MHVVSSTGITAHSRNCLALRSVHEKPANERLLGVGIQNEGYIGAMSTPRLFGVCVLASVSLACGDGGRSDDATASSAEGISMSAASLSSTTDDSDSDSDDPTADPTASTTEKFDAGDSGGGMEQGGDGGDDECGPEHLPTPDANLVGTVYAPNLQIPISGALVYLVDEDVEPVPDEVYCAECVELPCEKHYVLTEPNGSFSLPAVAGPGQKLVVQKGQFLHVTDMDVAMGQTNVLPADSSLPGEWNPAAGH